MTVADSFGTALALAITGILFAALAATGLSFVAVFALATVLAVAAVVLAPRVGSARREAVE